MANEPRWTAGNHPTPEELLLAREDQLPHQDAEPILAHLHQCWECRAQVERFTRGIDTYLKFRKLHLDPVATPRPGGWLRLSARLRDAEDPAVHSQALWKRVPRGIWLAASLAAAAALLAMLFVSPAPLTAKMVLHRALRAEAAGTGTPSIQRVLVRRAGALVATDNFVLQRAYVDRSRPLSVASHLSWHDSLHTRQDSVTTTPNEIRVETKTPESAISLASLTVASADYQPRARHVELRDGITIDVETVAPASATPEAEAVPPAREAPPAPKSVPAAEDREALEMEVRWALRRIDADLGEPLQIQAAGDDLVVKGTLDEAARRDQIAEALRAFPRVSTQLSLAVPDAGLLGKAQPIDPSGAASSPLLSSQLSKDLPDAEARRAFVSQALHLSHDILQHSWALRRLAERYPSSVANALSTEARASLDRLVAAHQEAIAAASREVIPLWKPYVQLDAGAVNSRMPWQTASLTALQNAQGLDHLTVRLLAAGGSDRLTVSDALRQLQVNFGRLQ